MGGIWLSAWVNLCSLVCSVVRSILTLIVSCLKIDGYSLSCTCLTIFPSSDVACLWFAGDLLSWSSSIHVWSLVSSSVTSRTMSCCTSVLFIMA